ncbi:S8 family serine peptidase [Argonema antarcticum]|uniref:S8 family serine peptidase n=1 Tax=Argonema antarcticum TaxID=2942763 RepID=UPI002012F432|nr:S8 family serine peptidase [Argonema antarcticum]MCL1472887.1 S8 family serine peptidase [Argonema antarcticum A004/B2]
MSTFDLGLLNTSYNTTDTLSVAYPSDRYNFTIGDSNSLKLSLTGISTNVDWQLKNGEGTTLRGGSVNPANLEAINLSDLAVGGYSFELSQAGGDTNYTLNVDPLTRLDVESGFFTVGQTGQVGVDYLIDGGGYQGELGIFSLTGIEGFAPGSSAFIKETSRRVLSNSTEGYVAITDSTEGAKFSPTFPWGDNQNSGEYKNIKTFAMKPGDKFGFMLVPNGKVQEVFNNPNIGGAKRPLFSLVTANPNEAFHVGQIADVIGDGKTFVMEDKRVDAGSDKDYNDLVFRVTGATGKAVNLDEVIDPGKDWRSEKIGDELRDYINTAPKSLQFTTKSLYKAGEIVNLTDATVYDENGDLMKIDFWVKKQNEVEWFDIKDAETFTFNENLASFNYSIDNLLAGAYQIKAIAFDKFEHQSEEIVRDFRINAAPKDLQFSLLKDTYNVGETISITGGQVYDGDGIDDLAKVNLFLKKDNNDWQDITDDVTSFTAGGGDNNLANFSKDLTVTDAGNYQIKGVAYDKAYDLSNVVIHNITVQSKTVEPAPNSPPEQLQFNLLPSYTMGQTVSINDAKVYDQNGESDLKNVKLNLYKDNDNVPQEITVNIVDDSKGGDGWRTFNYSWSNLLEGNYRLEAIAYDKFGAKDETSRIFSVVGQPTTPPPITNLPPKQLQLNLLPSYTVDQTVTFTNAKVYDENGEIDLDKISLDLYKDNVKLGNYTVGLVDDGMLADNWGTFNISFARLEIGNYRIEAKAYDDFGATDEDTAEFKVIPLLNQAPEDLRFSILPLYTNQETISFSGARVFDADGINDLEKIDFQLKRSDGIFFDIPDVTQFTTDSKGRARFDYNYDLTGLAPGQYQLWGIAKDKEGNLSNEAYENFALISDPGEDGLSDDVRLAIAEAADLGNYTPEELAATREWVVWLTPGNSSAELAASAGAEDLGATGHIPNTYIWKFPEGSEWRDAFTKLGETNGVELAYPQVPVELKLLYQPLDPLFSKQWNLPQTKVPDAWNSVRGRNTTIAVVDDGIEYRHKELQARYNPLLSWDFSDGDADPSPSSNKTFTQTNQGVTNGGEVSEPLVDTIDITFKQPVNLTGMVTDVNVSFNLKEFLSPDLPSLTDLKIFLYSPKESAFDPGSWFNSKSPSWWPGKEDLLFEQKVELKIQEDGTVAFNRDKLTGSYAGGDWKLVIENPDSDIYEFEQMERLSKEIFNSWSLQLQTLNPHGTAVAGVAVASENASGIVGVAPEAQLAGLRLLGNIDPFTGTYKSDGQLIANALFNWNRNQGIDIFNNSWAPRYMRRQPLVLGAMGLGKIIGRGGLGNSYIFAAGNEGMWGGNVNYNSFANSRHAIAVAALDNTGVHAPYSTPGASILVSAPLGHIKPHDGSVGTGVYTTSITTKGYGHTNDFTGTSAAAPLVSGAIALMLEANPNLTSRDVQHILVKTAQPTDVVRDASGKIQAGNGWTQNQAGYWFNHKYGFGVIDVDKAVEMAASWTPVDTEVKTTNGFEWTVQNVNEEIPNGNGLLEASSVYISEDITIEKVEVVLNVEHENWADLRVVLTSPDGTQSVLAQPISGDTIQFQPQEGIFTIKNWDFTSVRHWGESSKGEWKLQVFDEKDNQFQGEWNSWKLNIYGTQPTVTITPKDSTAIEDGNAGQFVVTRTGKTDKPLTVNYSITGNAINSIDYKTLTGSVKIPVGATMATIPIIPLADAEVEGNETVEIGLIDNADYNLGTGKSGTVTIENRTDISQYDPFVYTNPANGHLYIVSQPDTWLGAQEQAKTLGGNLVTINDAAENNWLVNTFGKRPFWIGLTDSSIYGTTEGNFKWVSEEIVTYTNWDGANPDNINFTPEGEDFVHINQGVGGTWNDLKHDYFLTYGIIEIDPATLTKPIVTIRATDAKAGEDGNAGQLIVTRIGNTTDPLTVNYSVFGNAINGTDYKNLTGNITISAGASVASIPIIPIFDNEVEGDETVAVKLLANAAYNVAPSETATVTIANSNTSPINPIIYSNPATGHQYFLTTADTWLGAQEQAKAAGGNLVASNDTAENAWLVNTFGGVSKWMGLTDSPIYNATEGNYKWVSGEPINYINWYPLEPSNSLHTLEGEDFSEFLGSGLWNDMPSQQNRIRQGIVEIPVQIPTNQWNARFINRTSANIADRNTYDFSNPAAVLDLGDQHQGRADSGLRLYRNWGSGSPTSGVQTDNFAMEAWTRNNFEAGKLYKITTDSDDGTWFRLKNVQTGQWTGDSVVLAGDGADWRDRGTAAPAKTIFFKVPESGEYDFYVQYYEKTSDSTVDINIEEAKVFQDSVNESQRWRSTVFWWDRKLGNFPPGDFYTNQSNIIGVVDQGPNIRRSDGKKGIEFSFPDFQSLNNDERLPDNNYAIRSYTQTNLEAGVKYRAKVRADDGFQLLAKLANTNEWVYITPKDPKDPKDQWQEAFGPKNVDFEVSRDGMYDMHFHYYEERGDAGLDLSWEVVPFTGRLLATTTTNIRSGPGTSYSLVGTIPYDGTSKTVTFDKWTTGEWVDYTAELGTISNQWYRIAGTNQWISGAIVGQKQYADI